MQTQYLAHQNSHAHTKSSPELSPEGVVVDLFVDGLRARLRRNEARVDAQLSTCGDLHGFTLPYRDRHPCRAV